MRRKLPKLFLYGGTAIVFLVLIAWVLTRPQFVHLNIDTTQKPDYVFENPYFVENLAGRPNWKLKAQKGELYKKDHYALLTVVSADIMTDDTNSVALDAPRARIDIATNIVKFFQCTLNVVQPDLLVRVDTLQWLSTRSLLKGAGNVKLFSKKFQIDANSFDAYIKDHRIVLEGRPKLEITID